MGKSEVLLLMISKIPFQFRLILFSYLQFLKISLPLRTAKRIEREKEKKQKNIQRRNKDLLMFIPLWLILNVIEREKTHFKKKHNK
jgi:hypothetical protein